MYMRTTQAYLLAALQKDKYNAKTHIFSRLACVEPVLANQHVYVIWLGSPHRCHNFPQANRVVSPMRDPPTPREGDVEKEVCDSAGVIVQFHYRASDNHWVIWEIRKKK